MYLVLHYMIDDDAADADAIRESLEAVIGERKSSELLPGLLITPLNSQRDFLLLYKRIEGLADASGGALHCAAFAAETGSRMRCNVVHDSDLAREICSHVPGV